MADMEAFCIKPTSDVPSFLHSKLKEGFETIFTPAISGNKQGSIENRELKKVIVDNFAQQPINIQTADDYISFMSNAMTATKHPTLEQRIQFLSVHAKLLRAVHKHAGTPYPAALGFVMPAQHPSPANTLTIFATSICRYTTPTDMEIRRIAHNDMQGNLEAILGTRLSHLAGRCLEGHAYLGLKEAMQNQVLMYALVFGIDHLLYPSAALNALLVATSDSEIRSVVQRNNLKQWMFKMCPECRQIRRLMKARVLDLADLRKTAQRTGV